MSSDLVGEVMHIDRFGNCTTDMPGEWLRAAAQWRFEAGGQAIDRASTTFGDVAEGELVVIVDSTDYVAIAVRNGNAAQRLQLGLDAPVDVWPVLST